MSNARVTISNAIRRLLLSTLMAAGMGFGACGGGGDSVVSCDIVQGGLHYCEEVSGSGSPGNTGCPMMPGFTPGTGCSHDGVTGMCMQGPYTFYVYGSPTAAQALARACSGAPDAGTKD
jgi:hypothetical protein